jgi:hypothetical protein
MFSIGLVQKAKDSAAKDAPGEPRQSSNLKVRLYHLLAVTKDVVLFGVPALLLWLALFFTKKRNTDLLIIAKRDE